MQIYCSCLSKITLFRHFRTTKSCFRNGPQTRQPSAHRKHSHFPRRISAPTIPLYTPFFRVFWGKIPICPPPADTLRVFRRHRSLQPHKKHSPSNDAYSYIFYAIAPTIHSRIIFLAFFHKTPYAWTVCFFVKYTPVASVRLSADTTQSSSPKLFGIFRPLFFIVFIHLQNHPSHFSAQLHHFSPQNQQNSHAYIQILPSAADTRTKFPKNGSPPPRDRLPL